MQECDSRRLHGWGSEAAARPPQTLRMTAVTRPRDRAAGQSGLRLRMLSPSQTTPCFYLCHPFFSFVWGGGGGVCISVGCAGGSVTSGLSGFLQQPGGSSDLAGADRLHLRYGLGPREKGQQPLLSIKWIHWNFVRLKPKRKIRENIEYSLKTVKCNQAGRRNIFRVARTDFLCVGLVFKNHARSLLNTEGWLQVYRSFGLGSSYADVMRFDCLLRYSEYEANDRNFPDFPSRLQGNIYQVPMCPFICSSKCEFDEMSEGLSSSSPAWSHGLFFRWEETFCWTKRGRSSLVTTVKRRWTGPIWRTSFGPRTRQSTKRSPVTTDWRAQLWSGTHCRHHRGRKALWLAFMMSRLALMTPWREVTEAEDVKQRRLLSPRRVSGVWPWSKISFRFNNLH